MILTLNFHAYKLTIWHSSEENTVLKYIVKVQDVRVCTVLRLGSVVGSCKHGNESSGSIKGEGCLCQLLNDSAW